MEMHYIISRLDQDLWSYIVTLHVIPHYPVSAKFDYTYDVKFCRYMVILVGITTLEVWIKCDVHSVWVFRCVNLRLASFLACTFNPRSEQVQCMQWFNGLLVIFLGIDNDSNDESLPSRDKLLSWAQLLCWFPAISKHIENSVTWHHPEP